MAYSIRLVLKRIFSNRNIMVITATTSIWTFIFSIYYTFWPLYLMELGATTEIIGFIAMIQSTAQLIFQLPGGILTDRIGRRKVIVYGSMFRLITPIIFIFATSWEMILPGVICQAIASVYMPAFNALIAESLPHEDRGSAFGAYRMITMLPLVVTSFFSGVFMDHFGVWDGTRMILIANIFASIVIVAVRYKFVTETFSKKQLSSAKKQSIKEALSELRTQPKTVWALVSVSCLSSFALRLSFSFFVLYAINVIGLTKTQWGLIGSIITIVSMSLSLPGGMLTDKIGRKPNILLARILSPITTLGLTFAKDFNQTLLVRLISSIGGGLGGGISGASGGPAWQALLADIIPSHKRGRVYGLMGTLTGLMGAPAPWIGGLMWDQISPDFTLQMSCWLGIIPAILFLLFVKEPKNKEK
ncbi:MAG: MFS transporter [Candidatus Hermodarchaeia archaeon]